MGKEKGDDEDTGNDGKLGGLELDGTKAKPAARTIEFFPDHEREHQKEEGGKIHRQGSPADPSVVCETSNQEDYQADGNPTGLFAPHIVVGGGFAHVGAAVDGDDAEGGEGEHDDEEHPVHAEEFAEQRGHAS